MKKFLITLSILMLSTISAKADLSFLSLTGGLAANQAVFGASGKESNRNETNVITSVNKETGVFEDSHSSQFIELGLGQWISVGYEHTPDSIETPTNVNTNLVQYADEATVSVAFQDLDTTYIKLNLPVLTGAYLKMGSTEVDINIKETTLSGRAYKDTSTTGSITALGYQNYLGDTGFGIRFEGAYLEFDNVSVDNGVSATGGTVANGGRNQIDVSDMQGLQGKIALTYTFGRN
jgi:hypothetical protein|tara:strand:- start:624 stop:1328 length:705 start_codon:yes stop_codon:yes gene_type:complete